MEEQQEFNVGDIINDSFIILGKKKVSGGYKYLIPNIQEYGPFMFRTHYPNDF